jgi:hypothetical protein
MKQNFNRALIIDEPHISRILAGEKIWEMRSRPTKIRGRIGLIRKGSGLIVGSAFLCRVGKVITDANAADTIQFHMVKDLPRLKKWKYPWVLGDVKIFSEPIPYKHPRGAVIWVKV